MNDTSAKAVYNKIKFFKEHLVEDLGMRESAVGGFMLGEALYHTATVFDNKKDFIEHMKECIDKTWLHKLHKETPHGTR